MESALWLKDEAERVSEQFLPDQLHRMPKEGFNQAALSGYFVS